MSEVMNKSTQRRVLSGREFNQLVFVAVSAFGYELRSFIQHCNKIASFPAKHSWQCVAPLLYGLALQTMDHFMTATTDTTSSSTNKMSS